MSKPTNHEVDDVIAAIDAMQSSGDNPFFGMTYLDGVRAAIDWMRGDVDESPLDE